MQTDSGRRLIRELRQPKSHAPTTLIPSKSGKPLTRGMIEPGTGIPWTDGRPGRGSEAEIQFNGQQDAIIDGRRYRSDVALYHEMVHALHDVRGTTDWSWVERDDGVPADVQPWPTRRAEHQATGLGRYEVTPHNDNLYRSERRALAFSGEGRPGDLTMPDRESYRGGSTYSSFFGL